MAGNYGGKLWRETPVGALFIGFAYEINNFKFVDVP